MKKKEFIAFIIPSTLSMLLITIGPSIYTVYISFFHQSFITQSLVFVGLDNFKTVLHEIRFWNALGNTFFYMSMSIPIELLLGFTGALLLEKINRVRGFVTGSLLLPYILVPVVAALAFGWIFRGNFGILNYFITSIGLKPPEWFADPWAAKFMLIIFEVWKNTPFSLIILFAGLQTIPVQISEASDIDGINFFQKIIYIKIPLLKNHLIFILIITIMNCFQMFDSVYVLTGGGPGANTELVAFYNYQIAFKESNIGKSATIVILTIIFIAITSGYLLFEVYKQYEQEKKPRVKKLF